MLACFLEDQHISHIACDERALHYGDGLFTTIRIEKHHPTLWAFHLRRLQRDCGLLGFSINWVLLEQQFFTHCQKFDDAVCKIMISRGAGQLGYATNSTLNPQYYFYFFELPAAASRPLAVKLLTDHPLPDDFPALVGVKSLNRLPQVILQRQLSAAGQAWDEALLIDRHGMIVEGVAHNIFFCREGQWYTPSLIHNGVHGVMRAWVLERCAALAMPVHQTSIHYSQCDTIEALVFTNAVRGMRVANRIDAQPLSDHISEVFIADLNESASV